MWTDVSPLPLVVAIHVGFYLQTSVDFCITVQKGNGNLLVVFKQLHMKESTAKLLFQKPINKE